MQQGRVPFSACEKFTTAPGAAPGVAGKSGVRSGGKSQCTSTTTIDEDHDQMALYVPMPQPETACITSQLPVRSRGFLAGGTPNNSGGLRGTNWGFTRRFCQGYPEIPMMSSLPGFRMLATRNWSTGEITNYVLLRTHLLASWSLRGDGQESLQKSAGPPCKHD